MSDHLAAYEIYDVVGLEDGAEKRRSSFGTVYEFKAFGVGWSSFMATQSMAEVI